MTMQLNKTSADSIVPVTNVGYAKPSLEVLSCRTCNIEGGCLAEQLTVDHDHSYQLVKNRKEFTKGEHIYCASEKAKAIYVLRSGSVKSYILMKNGEEQILDFYMPGDVFGLDAMGSNHHITSAVALEPASVCRLSLPELRESVLGEPFLNMVSGSITRDHNLTLMLARKDADSRLATFLIDMSKRIEKYGYQSKSYSVDEVKLSMTRQEIANYLGLAMETVSRVLRRFQDNGILGVSRRKVKIYDYNALLSIAGTQVTF